MESIKVMNAALDEIEGGTIVLRGVIDPDDLHHLQSAEYQREVLPLAALNDLIAAMKGGARVPDIDLGMRGQKFVERQGNFYLQDPVFVIDGLQRISAAMHLMRSGPGIKPRIGALIHFSTTEAWERERFRLLNTSRAKLSPSVLIRNKRHDVPVIDMLYTLTMDRSFVLNDRVSWAQRMRRQDILTALTYCKTVGRLHSHAGPGRHNSVDELTVALQRTMGIVGRGIMRDNVRTFFDIVDQAWGVKSIAFKEGAAYMRGGFLYCLATLLSRHYDFWRGASHDRLFVEAPLLRKLAAFPVSDPNVVNLAGSGGKSVQMLYLLMLDHVNNGKRTRRLRSRGDAEALPDAAEDELVEDAA